MYSAQATWACSKSFLTILFWSLFATVVVVVVVVVKMRHSVLLCRCMYALATPQQGRLYAWRASYILTVESAREVREGSRYEDEAQQ